MAKCISAYTKLDPTYPGYINFTREEDGTVSVYLRADPAIVENSAYICGYERDRGKPGRCTPGDEHCNNYCNMAPQKGPMQPHPAKCRQVICGEVAKLSLSGPEFAALVAELKA